MSYFRSKKQVAFTGRHGKKIDYKDVKLLKEYITETGLIVPSRVTGTQAFYQRKLTKAIKLARYLSLIPYCDMHE